MAVAAIGFYAVVAFLSAIQLTRIRRVAIARTPADLGLEFEHIAFPSRGDGLVLKGWFIPAAPGDPADAVNAERAILMVHGKGQNRADTDISMLEIAAGLARSGFNVLPFDLRGYGESEGVRFSLGYHERKDVAGAIDYLRKRGFPAAKIGVLAYSMGAATTLLTITETESAVGALVSDSAYAEIRSLIDREYVKATRLPRWFVPGVLGAARLLWGVDTTIIRPEVVIGRLSPLPILLIHGEGDTLVPLEHCHRLHGVADPATTEVWLVPAARHVQGYNTVPEAYLDRVARFFSESLA